jgi:hypothetical protein
MEKRIRLRQESDAESPREWCNISTMVCWHRRYKLGDEQPKADPQEWRLWLASNLVGGFNTYVENVPEKHVQAALDKHICVIMPLYLYDHSGITMSTSRFSCPWDSGQVGWIYCTWEKARQEYSGTDQEIEELVTKALIQEVEVYDQYLTGDVWYYVCEQSEDGEDWEDVDGCGGFYGRDLKRNGMMDHIPAEFQDAELVYE